MDNTGRIEKPITDKECQTVSEAVNELKELSPLQETEKDHSMSRGVEKIKRKRTVTRGDRSSERIVGHRGRHSIKRYSVCNSPDNLFKLPG